MSNTFSPRRAIALAVATLSIQCALLPKAQANPLAIPAVAACTASVACITGVVVIGGITYYWIQWQGQQKLYYSIQQGPYPSNPEDEDTWTESVSANNLADARRQCRALARSRGVALEKVAPTSRTGKTFLCHFRG